MMKTENLRRGRISVSVQQHHPDWHIDNLIDFAERINPKRAFLFVSKVLGKHIPVAPHLMNRTYRDLWELIPKDLATPLTVIGMAETAIGLGSGIYREVKKQYGHDALFVTTTRHPIKTLPTLGLFLEEHSHAQDQFILSSHDSQKHQQLIESKTLILVDDEISTGRTFKNLIQSLQRAGLTQVERIILVSLVNWASGDLVTDDLGLNIDVVSLLHGRWSWEDFQNALPVEMPHVNVTRQAHQNIIAPPCWGREPSYLECKAWNNIPAIKANEKVLVLGSGEFSWIPFLIAEQLEQQGIETYFSATTRSPIMLGHAIQSACYFRDHYGQNIQNYVYNVAHQDFDRIFLVIETQADSVDPALFQQIPHLEIISYEP